MTCPQCAAEIPPTSIVCPLCHTLIHSAELKTVAANAEQATASGDLSTALQHWRRALELLPPESTQYRAIATKINDLVMQLEHAAPAEAAKKPSWAGKGGALGALGLILWKLKFAVIFFLTKAKLLILGLTKASTFFSMLLSIGLYCTAFGWKFAVGLVGSIYVHEMGHVYQLNRYGIRATAPTFIPFFGALIRLRQRLTNPHEEARVGLAGPIWGLACAVVFWVVSLLIDAPICAALAKTGAWINLFNLMPVWQLDGSHAFKALSRIERIGITVLMLIAFVTTQEGLLLLLTIVAAVRCFEKAPPTQRDLQITGEFAVLIVALSLLTQIAAPTPM